MTDPVERRLREFVATAASPARLPPGATRVLAVGWATVELERAVPQLAGILGTTDAAFVEVAGSTALGARCLAAGGLLDDDVLLAVVEPSTEGRLAAALARWDEGPVVAWYAIAAESVAPGTGIALPGPFGPEWVVRGDPLTGPHRLLVASETGTIAS
jgi:hypothetical protein